ncbi:MAG TPA: Mth938-like domain-containing protein [Gammaproteobacteria bacterium]|nr:Mth938-like domain-containing protein [Gammaproteobacteria bacterium]
MANFSLDNNLAAFQIRAFQPGTIQVNDQIITKSLIISAQQLITEWPPQHAQEITSQHLAVAAALEPEIILIGTGSQQLFLPLEIYGEYINKGIGIEIMNSAAACRTFNALTAENRNVVAAIILT